MMRSWYASTVFRLLFLFCFSTSICPGNPDVEIPIVIFKTAFCLNLYEAIPTVSTYSNNFVSPQRRRVSCQDSRNPGVVKAKGS